jgi:arylsulfatase A-like enzyme
MPALNKLVAFILVLCSGVAYAAQQSARKLNVLFIVADDLRPELGCYGKPNIHSPNIDRLAGAGFLFERAYCQQALCAPTRASLLTACRPDTTGVHGLQVPLGKTRPDLVTLPQTFKNAGYETISLGKVYHHGAADDPQGWSQPPWTPTGPWVGAGVAGAEAVAIFKREQERSKDGSRIAGPPTDIADVPDNGLPDGVIAEKAVEELRRLQSRPFFLAVGFAKPHLPFSAPRKYWEMYQRDQIHISEVRDWPKDMPSFAGMDSGELRQYLGIPKKGNVPDDQARELIHGYYACVSYVDAQVGKVLDELDRLGLRENTIVVLWGDHGWKLSEYSAWCKHTNFEVDTRSPLLLQVPGMAGGRKMRHLVEFVDVYPTLAELCGFTAPQTCEGTSMVPLLKEPQRPVSTWKRAAFSQYQRENGSMGYSMRTERYRFTEWVKDGSVIARELYDHQDADLDLVNLANRPEYADLVARLSAQRQAGWQAARPQIP